MQKVNGKNNKICLSVGSSQIKKNCIFAKISYINPNFSSKATFLRASFNAQTKKYINGRFKTAMAYYSTFSTFSFSV